MDILNTLKTYEIANRKAEELGESAKITPVLVGKQGVGKSALVREYAKMTGAGLVIIEMAQLNEIDFMGVISFMNSINGMNEEEICKVLHSKSALFHTHTIPQWIYRSVEMIEKYGKVVIMFDEINRARTPVLNALMNFFLTGEFGSDKIKLPRDKVFIVGAMNPDDGEFSVNEIDPAIENRFVFINVEPSLNRLLEGYGEKLHPLVVEFLINNPKLLDTISKDDPTKQLTARKWDMISRMLVTSKRAFGNYNTALYALKDLFPSAVDGNKFAEFVSKTKTIKYSTLQKLIRKNILKKYPTKDIVGFLNLVKEMNLTIEDDVKHFDSIIDYFIISSGIISEKSLSEKRIEALQKINGIELTISDKVQSNVEEVRLDTSDKFLQMLELFRISKTVPLIQGPAGIGKTQKVETYAKMIGAELIKLELANIDLVDFYGYLNVIEKAKGEDTDVDKIIDLLSEFSGGRVTNKINVHINSAPSWLLQIVRAIKEGKPAILYLDEFNRAKPDVLNSAMNLILEGNIGQYKLPDNCMIILSGNPSDEYDTESLDPAQADRFIPINMNVDIDEWINFAKKAGIHEVIIEYLLEKPEDLFKKKVKEKDPDVNPRRWSMMSYLLLSMEDMMKDNIKSLSSEEIEKFKESFLKDVNSRIIELLGVEVGGRFSSVYLNYLESILGDSDFNPATSEFFIKLIKEKLNDSDVETLKNDKELRSKVSQLESIRSIDIMENLVDKVFLEEIGEEVLAVFISHMMKEDVARNILYDTTIHSEIYEFEECMKSIEIEGSLKYKEIIKKMKKESVDDLSCFLKNESFRSFFKEILIKELDEKYKLDLYDSLIDSLVSGIQF